MTLPFFSIIVPTYNRSEELRACIHAITQLDYPRDRFEVIIVDDGSSVPVNISGHHRWGEVMIAVLRQFNAGPASARNVGAQKACGEILAFTDDDCIPSPQWLKELAGAFHKAPLDLIGGRTINGLVKNVYSTASQIIADEAYAYFFSRNSDIRFFASNNMAVSAKLFHECGGFDSSFRTSEDRDFCDRWIRHGHILVYASEAIVHHHHHLTFTTFCRQHFNYGRGAYRFHRGRAKSGRSFLKPDLLFYASVFRRALFSPWSKNSLLLAGLMGLWQLANLAGFISQRLSQRPFLFNSAYWERPVQKNTIHKDDSSPKDSKT